MVELSVGVTITPHTAQTPAMGSGRSHRTGGGHKKRNKDIKMAARTRNRTKGT